MKKRITLALICVLMTLVLVFAGCAKNAEEPTEPTTEPTTEATEPTTEAPTEAPTEEPTEAPTEPAGPTNPLTGEAVEEELTYYRRGKNAHPHGIPNSATPAEYTKATGLEALFGYLFLSGQKERANEIFQIVMKEM